MSLPKSINIFGLDYKVKIVKELKDDDGNMVDGLFCSKDAIISIDKDNKNKMHTLIHEMGHAMFHRVSIGQTDINDQVEEIINNNWATLMTEVFDLKFKRKK